MFSISQGVIDWFSALWDVLIAALNPINLIVSIASYVASLLPDSNPSLIDVVNGSVAALDTFVRFVGLADYVINLPIFLIVISIVTVAEASFNVIRLWRILRSFVT